MAHGSQKAALLAAKDDLLAAYTSVHASLGRLISLVHHSEPGAIADALGSEFDPHAHHPPAHARHRSDAGPSFTPVPPSAAHLQPSYTHQQSQSNHHAHHPSYRTHKPSQGKHSRPSVTQAGYPSASHPPLETDEEEEEEEEEEDEPTSDDGHHHHVQDLSYSSQHRPLTTVPTPPGSLPNGKKAREKKVKRERDPNAPKRPASAYILFQNAVRQEMRAANPTADYKELARQIGDRWKNLSEEAKRPWSEAGKQAMSSWNIQNKEYKNLHSETTSPHTHSNSSGGGGAPHTTTANSVPRKKRSGSHVVEYDEAGNPVRKKRGRPSKFDKVDQFTAGATGVSPPGVDTKTVSSVVKLNSSGPPSANPAPTTVPSHPNFAPLQATRADDGSAEEVDEDEDEEGLTSPQGQAHHHHHLHHPSHSQSYANHRHHPAPQNLPSAPQLISSRAPESEEDEEEEEEEEEEDADEDEGEEDDDSVGENNGAPVSHQSQLLRREMGAVMA